MQTLHDVFGVNRFCTIHQPDLWLGGGDRSDSYEVPEELARLSGAELLEALRTRPEPFFIKSHRPKDFADPAPALYLVRDGRDVHVSYAHWVKDKEFRVRGKKTISPGLSFPERLRMVVSRPNWSRHVHLWRTRSAPTALVRYEELVEDPTGTITRACGALKVPLPEPKGNVKPFSELRRRNPSQHRRGKVGSWRDEMPPEIEESFWSIHGEEMGALDYSRAGDSTSHYVDG